MLRDRFKESLAEAMKAQDEISVSTLRLILAALKDREIAARSKGSTACPDDDAIMDLLQSMVRQRRESISLYQTAQRLDLAEREQKEIEVIERFLPRQLTGEELEAAVKETIAEIGADSLKDIGRTMGALKERYAGQMDFAKASAVVKEQLG